MSDTVRIKWKLETGEFPVEDVEREGLGGTDAMVLVSIRRGPKAHQGDKSFALVSVDGYSDKDCPDTELFQALAFLAKRVSDGDGPLWQKEMCRGFFEAVRSEIMNRRGQN